MRAITLEGFGGPEVLTVANVPDPTPGPGEVLIEVSAIGVNRADLLQRQCNYPPPPGAPAWPGLECSGYVIELGAGVDVSWLGRPVCALLSSGGYAEQVVAPIGQVMPLPHGVDLITSAALPEVACTVWSNVVMMGQLKVDEWLLIHGGSSGIGTHAIQVARALGAHVAVTAGSAAKLQACADLGAELLINYREQDFVEVVEAKTPGIDVILDNMGAAYLPRNVKALNTGGRLLVIGLQGGAKGELDLGALLMKRATVTATSLRARTIEQKTEICNAVVEQVWPFVATGKVRPVVHAVMPFERAADAHRLLESSEHIGKVLLQVR